MINTSFPLWTVMVMAFGIIGGMTKRRGLQYTMLAFIAVILTWRLVTAWD